MAKNVDQKTGEVIVFARPRVPALPDMKTVSNISAAVGKNPPVENLRDHQEWAGFKIMCVKVLSFNDGAASIEYPGKPWARFACFIYPEGTKLTEENREQYYHVVMTGAENVLERFMSAQDVLPVEGTLRKAGRAWLVD